MQTGRCCCRVHKCEQAGPSGKSRGWHDDRPPHPCVHLLLYLQRHAVPPQLHGNGRREGGEAVCQGALHRRERVVAAAVLASCQRQADGVGGGAQVRARRRSGKRQRHRARGRRLPAGQKAQRGGGGGGGGMRRDVQLQHCWLAVLPIAACIRTLRRPPSSPPTLHTRTGPAPTASTSPPPPPPPHTHTPAGAGPARRQLRSLQAATLHLALPRSLPHGAEAHLSSPSQRSTTMKAAPQL